MGNLQALSYVFRFNQILRVRSEECKRILELIKNYAVFKTSSNATQHPIKLQLKIVLYRLGSSGDGQSVRKVASLFYELPASTTYPTSNRLVELLFIKVIKLSSTTAELFNLLPKISPNSS
nr:uncharacterized protein LOC106623841 isoform X2 [Bactrocera oleae]